MEQAQCYLRDIKAGLSETNVARVIAFRTLQSQLDLSLYIIAFERNRAHVILHCTLPDARCLAMQGTSSALLRTQGEN